MAAASNRRKTSNSSKQSTHRYTTEGSAARQLQTAPVRQPKKTTRTTRQKRNVTVKARPLNPFSLVLLGAAIIATICVCADYVQLQTQVTVRLKKINAKEIELNDMVKQNDELEARINNYMDLQYIYQVATEELGMTYPTADQISEYENSGSEYVRQYESIPDVPKAPLLGK